MQVDREAPVVEEVGIQVPRLHHVQGLLHDDRLVVFDVVRNAPADRPHPQHESETDDAQERDLRTEGRHRDGGAAGHRGILSERVRIERVNG
jgi:hypothetical protein